MMLRKNCRMYLVPLRPRRLIPRCLLSQGTEILGNMMCLSSSVRNYLTTDAPEKLVERYGEYAHGDPRKERKVLLDRQTLEPINLAGNIRVVPRGALAERFLSTLGEQASIAAGHKEQVMMFIFGHGDLDTHGVYLGKRSGSQNQYPELFIQDFSSFLARVYISWSARSVLLCPTVTKSLANPHHHLRYPPRISQLGPIQSSRARSSWPCPRRWRHRQPPIILC